EVDVARLAATTTLADEHLAGRLKVNARVSYAGSGGAGYGGGGRIELERGKVQELPVFSTFLSALSGTQGKDSTLSAGHADFALAGDRVDWRDVLIEGPVMAGCGGGSCRVDGEELELSLVPRLGSETTVIPIIGDITQKLLDVVKGQLIEVELRGSLAAPTSRVAPLKFLTAPIRAFLGGGGGKRRGGGSGGPPTGDSGPERDRR
ncbi:MAG: hypothetical protein HZA54_14925, partial [Planctomycetes bacterium]|nr:hypothetical protein [Planctomycetota bacterium]